MQVHRVVLDTVTGSEHWRFICSDLHIGSPSFEASRWVRDMEAAKRVGARVLANGDVFDGIDFRDKRFDANVLVPSLRGEKDLQGAVVRLAHDYFRPYRHLVDVIGIGNHEEKCIAWNATDPVARLIERLNADLEKDGTEHRIRHGGICGYIRTTFRFGKDRGPTSGVNHDLLYMHGSGGDSPVTKGAIDFYRKQNQFSYDAMTMGHKHHRTFGDSVMIGLSPKGRLVFKETKSIQTGSYYTNYRRGSQKHPLNYSYAESKHHSPKPWGGMFLRMRPVRETKAVNGGNCSFYRVMQDVMTEP